MKNKLKTKSAITKRIKISKSGKLKKHNAYTSHLALNKTTKQKRQSRKANQVNESDKKRWKNLY